ncbi:hypothetical protein QTH91_22320 [Variovorax dokdonensis]|uniref:Uncharacterized protein n=1 Tax=Variovorax dokdonensis TaxID=344883 RepID=A0ABT7NH70_9BURK|nr:hypothetical protein [Variovorax dokdonensis]MDM0047245.1 hypothetical protein [Variovorax dokdonensis]
MSLTLLQKLSMAELPVAVTDGSDVDGLRILKMAGHVRAEIPSPVRTLTGYMQPPALAIAITALGRQMLERFPQLRGSSRS